VVTFGQRYPTVQVRYVIAAAYWESHRNRPRGIRGVPEVVPELIPDPGTSGTSESLDRGALREILGLSKDLRKGVSDLAWWVREIERTLGDTQSSGFYKQVVEAFAAARALDALELVLRGVQRDGTGAGSKALGAAFTARVKARAAELKIVLPGTSTAPTRGAGVTAIGALLPPAGGSPVPKP